MKASLNEVLSRLPGPRSKDWPAGEPFAVALQQGSMLLEVFAPRGTDSQAPHAKDEIYLVISGAADLEVEGKMTPAKAGDALFVRAFAEHRFHNISDDFVTWVVFWGPKGGEAITEN